MAFRDEGSWILYLVWEIENELLCERTTPWVERLTEIGTAAIYPFYRLLGFRRSKVTPAPFISHHC